MRIVEGVVNFMVRDLISGKRDEAKDEGLKDDATGVTL